MTGTVARPFWESPAGLFEASMDDERPNDGLNCARGMGVVLLAWIAALSLIGVVLFLLC